jgi:restriction system protein
VDTEQQIRQLFDNVLILWPLGLILVAIGAVKLVVWVRRERRLARSGINDIDRMDGRTFEEYLRTAFVRLGYKVEVTKYRGDFGADLVVRKDGRKITVKQNGTQRT